MRHSLLLLAMPLLSLPTFLVGCKLDNQLKGNTPDPEPFDSGDSDYHPPVDTEQDSPVDTVETALPPV